MTTAGSEPGHINPGKVLSDTGDILKKSFATIWIVALILFIPVAILGYFSDQGWLINLIYSIATLVASLYMAGIVVRVVQDVEADGKVDASVGDLFGSITPKLWSILLLSIVTGILIVIGFFFFIIPGIILALMWLVAVPALVAEDLGVFAAMSRSSELTKGNRWRLIGVFILIYILLIVMGIIVALFVAITPILGVIIGLLLAIVIYPYVSIIIAVVYYELLEAKGESKPGPGVGTMAPPSGEMPA
ncbi:MAG: hypothetical protein F2813_05710 [Actinobacteria bacterium]|uniref:Unannotated protein n=1 Tax=freshwater metagenome TaxID=449393 RepID=A0A6J5ZVS5_9ZZZZ|nr:hypothetical protein [Actinomycetota bacterium]